VTAGRVREKEKRSDVDSGYRKPPNNSLHRTRPACRLSGTCNSIELAVQVSPVIRRCKLDHGLPDTPSYDLTAVSFDGVSRNKKHR
jgi:hypothetical protein